MIQLAEARNMDCIYFITKKKPKDQISSIPHAERYHYPLPYWNHKEYVDSGL